MFYSVLIPVYNVIQYLEECVYSVLNQNEDDLEIILLDDGSTDGSGELCDKLKNKYTNIIRVIHKENEGLLLTRRRGLKESKGDWIVHLDSDDYMMPNVLKNVRNAIEETGADLIIGKVAYGENDGKTIKQYSRIPFKNKEDFNKDNKNILIQQFLVGGYLTAIYQKIANRKIIDIESDYSMFSSVSISEDYLQTFPLLNNSKHAIYLDVPFVFYRKNNESMTKKNNYKSYQNSFWSKLTVFEQEQYYLSLWNVSSSFQKQIFTLHLRSLCRDIKNILCIIQDNEKSKVYNELSKISSSDMWNNIFKQSNKINNGLFSYFCYYLIKKHLFSLLRIICINL